MSLFSSVVGDSLSRRFPESCVDFFQKSDCIIDKKKLIVKEKLSNGSFGTVHKGEYDGQPVAIKYQNVPLSIVEECTNVMVELSLMQSMPHEKLVSYIGASCENINVETAEVIIVMELCDRGCLKDVLNLPMLPWKQRVRMALDVAWGIQFLHENDIVHRDIKSSNVLIDQKWRAKICDLSFACHRFSTTKMEYSCGTDAYMSPEIILAMDCDISSDIFSYGIMLCSIITGKEPSDTFLQRTAQTMFELNEQEVRDALVDGCPEALEALAYQCCDLEPQRRPSILQCIEELEAILFDLGGADFIFQMDRRESFQLFSTAKTSSIRESHVNPANRESLFSRKSVTSLPTAAVGGGGVRPSDMLMSNIGDILVKFANLEKQLEELRSDNRALSQEVQVLRAEFSEVEMSRRVDLIGAGNEHERTAELESDISRSLTAEENDHIERVSLVLDGQSSSSSSSRRRSVGREEDSDNQSPRARNNSLRRVETISAIRASFAISNERENNYDDLRIQVNNLSMKVDTIGLRLGKLEGHRFPLQREQRSASPYAGKIVAFGMGHDGTDSARISTGSDGLRISDASADTTMAGIDQKIQWMPFSQNPTNNSSFCSSTGDGNDDSFNIEYDKEGKTGSIADSIRSVQPFPTSGTRQRYFISNQQQTNTSVPQTPVSQVFNKPETPHSPSNSASSVSPGDLSKALHQFLAVVGKCNESTLKAKEIVQNLDQSLLKSSPAFKVQSSGLHSPISPMTGGSGANSVKISNFLNTDGLKSAVTFSSSSVSYVPSPKSVLKEKVNSVAEKATLNKGYSFASAPKLPRSDNEFWQISPIDAKFEQDLPPANNKVASGSTPGKPRGYTGTGIGAARESSSSPNPLASPNVNQQTTASSGAKSTSPSRGPTSLTDIISRSNPILPPAAVPVTAGNNSNGKFLSLNDILARKKGT